MTFKFINFWTSSISMIKINFITNIIEREPLSVFR
jgi:hypothetical protein